jgi:hypothetical protein
MGMLHLLPLPVAEVVGAHQALLVVGEVVEAGMVTIPDRMLEVSAVLQGVAHILVIRALGIEDVVQCSLASAGCTSGTRDGWSSSMDLFTRPLLPMLVGLLVRVAPRCRRSRLRSPNEVLSPFVGGDVDVCFSKQLLGGGRRLLQYGSDEGRVI